MDDAETTLTRREVLERAGVAAAIMSVPAVDRLTSAAGAATRPARALRIGQLLTLSGPLGSVGLDLQKGFVTYVRQNASRLGGRKIQFFVEDDAGDPRTALQKAERLVSEREVDVVTGVVLSNVAIALRDFFHSAKVPLIISNAAADELTRGESSPYIFRAAYTNYMIGASMGRWFYRNIAKNNVFTAAPNYSAGQEIVAGFITAFERAGGKIGGRVFPPFGTVSDYQPFLSQIQGERPSAVFAFFPGAEAIRFVRQYSEFGLKRTIPLHGAFITDPAPVLNAQGSAAQGIGSSAVWAAELQNQRNARFLATYERLYGKGEPSTFAATGHNAAQLLDVALRSIKGDTSNQARFLRALKNVGTFQTPSGIFTLDPKTQNPIRNFYLRQARFEDGKWQNKLLSLLGSFRDPGR